MFDRNRTEVRQKSVRSRTSAGHHLDINRTCRTLVGHQTDINGHQLDISRNSVGHLVGQMSDTRWTEAGEKLDTIRKSVRHQSDNSRLAIEHQSDISQTSVCHLSVFSRTDVEQKPERSQ